MYCFKRDRVTSKSNARQKFINSIDDTISLDKVHASSLYERIN